ncbi:MAG: hypothetical protein PWQ54_1384 [Bacteroidales bacterium]|jgi:hypothetical protein|nr:hypothetical protein [Bacteroidales bacterium]
MSEKSPFDYDPKKDDLPTNVIVWIAIIAFAAAIYLSQVLV